MKQEKIRTLISAVLAAIATSLFAYDFEYDGIYYNITSKSMNTCCVTFKSSDFFDRSYQGDVVIPQSVNYEGIVYTVTSIGTGAFEYCTSLTSVTIPASVSSIGSDAFHWCSGLSDVFNLATIPQNIETTTFFPIPKTLHVYEGFKNVYANANTWANFKIVDDIPVNKITSLTFDKHVYECFPYQSVSPIITITPSDASVTDLEWKSSDESVAIVTSSGKIICKEKGSSIITVTAKDGSSVSARCQISVSQLPNEEIFSYNRYLSYNWTGSSMTKIGSYIRKAISLSIKNTGTDCIYIIKLIWKNPNTYETISSSTDTNQLGWLADGEAKSLSVSLTMDINPVYEFQYLYKGKQFVFCTDKEDPDFVDDNNKGDVNGDNSVDVSDIAAVLDVMSKGNEAGFSMEVADVNGDGGVDVADIGAILTEMSLRARMLKDLEE